AVLAAPECAAAFTAPSPHAIVWRERSFDLITEGGWVSGTFDRVLIDRDSAGRPLSAWIVDYKTDDISDDAKLESKCQGYAPQIALYRQAIARLAGLPEEKVRASLLFTRLLKLV
ncbi:MAG TPA: DNA helicase UvrD, partial [Verrucomicrobiales bacterium]|nr:DNA helicase UvrD [Verrucomicrobiales bacterium]